MRKVQNKPWMKMAHADGLCCGYTFFIPLKESLNRLNSMQAFYFYGEKMKKAVDLQRFSTNKNHSER